MSSLIIGANGFLGRSLVTHFISSNENFYFTDKSFVPGLSIIKEQFISLQNLESINAYVDRVFLLASHIPYGTMNEISSDLIESNINLPLRITKIFPNARIVFASSVAVYDVPDSLTAYGKSKLAGEIILQAVNKYTILRFPSLFGPEMKSPTFIKLIIEKALTTGTIPLLGDGTRLQNYLYVRDAAKMLKIASESSTNCVCNAVGAKSYSNLEIANCISQLMGNVTITYKGNDRSPSAQYSNTDWIKNFGEFNYTPIDEALRETIDGISNR